MRFALNLSKSYVCLNEVIRRMNTRKALKDLVALKAMILEDGVIDYDETTKLLEYIEQYISSDHKIFADFKATVDACRKDGKITNEESEQLKVEIDTLLHFLTMVMIIECVFGSKAMKKIITYVLGSAALISLIAAGICFVL